MKAMFKKAKKFFSAEDKSDPKPHKVLTGMNRPASTAELVKQVVSAELSKAAEMNGYESFDEANDFSIDDSEPTTDYELDETSTETGFISEPPPEPEPEPEPEPAPEPPTDPQPTP